MKKEVKIRIFCAILLLLGAAYHLYVRSESFAAFLLLSPLMLSAAFIPSKKIHAPDYSGPLSFIGVLFAALSYFIYFMPIDLFQNITFEIVCCLIIFIYYVFLMWYKNVK